MSPNIVKNITLAQNADSVTTKMVGKMW